MTAGELERIGELLGTAVPGGRQPDLRCETAHCAEAASAEKACGAGAPRRSPGATLGPAAAVPGDLARLLAVVWPQVVGPDVARNAHPVYYRHGRLVVSTASAAWAQALQDMSESIRSGLNARLGAEHIKRVVFRHAGWSEAGLATTSGPVHGAEVAEVAEPVTAAKAPPRDGGDKRERGGREDPGETRGETAADIEEVLAQVAGLPLEPGLKARIQAAMRAALVRGQKDFVCPERTKKEPE